MTQTIGGFVTIRIIWAQNYRFIRILYIRCRMCGFVWRGRCGFVWSWCGFIRSRCGVVYWWGGMIRYGMVWTGCGMVRCGMGVWKCGMCGN